MKIELQCDKCGKRGDAKEISTDPEGRDLCRCCEKKEELSHLKDYYAKQMKWMGETHLRELHNIEKEIKRLERDLAPQHGVNTPLA